MTPTAPRLVSLICPVFNEEANLPRLYERLTRVMQGLAPRYEYEFVFTDNHSIDGTFAELQRLAAQDTRVRVIRFSRNFGFQRSILTGYLNARGDVAVQLDADLQDPPELIPEFLRLWEQGHEVVYGVRRKRQEGWAITAARRVFYWLIDRLSKDRLPRDAGDFRLVDRRILDELALIEDSQPYLRGTIAALGFRQVGVPYDRAAREAGESKFPVAALTRLALDGILNHSTVPLRLATYVGGTTLAAGLLSLVVTTMASLAWWGAWPSATAALAHAILISGGMNALFVGVLGEYLGRIYQQVKRRPLVVVEREIDAARGKFATPREPASLQTRAA